jgi:hypothetical protein
MCRFNVRSFSVYFMLTVLGGMILAGCSGDGALHREPLAEKSWSTFRTLETLHRMPALPKVTSRNDLINHGVYDETLFPPDATVRDEMAVARDIGVVAVAQEHGLGEFMAADSGLSGIVMGNMSPLMLAGYGTNIKDPEGIARYLKTLLDSADQYPDRVMKIEGKTVLFIFNSYMVSGDNWKKIRAEIETKDHPLFLMHHAHVFFTNPELNRQCMQIFDGAFIWGGDTAQKKTMVDQLIHLRNAMMTNGTPEFPIMMTAEPGYWRPEAGWWRSRAGTKDFRDFVRYNFENRLGWMLYESWDDFGENTLIQPSIHNHTAMVELAAFYAHIGNGQARSAAAPGLLSAHPAEALRGRSFNVEMIQLPVDQLKAAPVHLIVRNGRGDELYRSADLQLDPEKPEAVTVTLPADLTAHQNVLCPAVERAGKTVISGSHVIVRENRLHDMLQYHLEAARLMHPEKFDFTINGQKPGNAPLVASNGTAQVTVVSSGPIRRIELVRNGRAVGAVDSLRRNGPRSRTLAVFWDAPTAMPGEHYAFSGQVSVEKGQILRGFVDRLGVPMSVAGSVAKWQVPGGTLHGVSTVVFSGDENTRFNFSFPGAGKEFSATWQEITGDVPLEFPLTAHSAVRLEPTDVPSGLPELQDIHEGTYSFPLPKKGEFPVDAYHIRLIGDNFRIARSFPILVKTDKFKSRVESTTWSFDRPTGRIEPDREGLGYHAELGGSFERAGGYDQSRVPVRKDGALVFDGTNDVVVLPPNLLPQAGVRIALRIRPDRLPYTTPQQLIGCQTFGISLDSGGRINADFGEAGRDKASLHSLSVLQAGQWCDIELIHDGHQLVLRLNGGKEASAPLELTRDGVTPKVFLGADPSGRNAFSGAVDFLQITAAEEACK